MKRTIGIRILWSLVLSLAAPAFAHAYGGDISGGGGNSVVCFKDPDTATKVRAQGKVDGFFDQIKYVQTYDYFEALHNTLPRGEIADVIPAPASAGSESSIEWAYVAQVRRRIAPYFPGFDQALGETIRRLQGNIRYTQNSLPLLDDMNESTEYDRKLCVLVTTAINHYGDHQDSLELDSRLLDPAINRPVSRGALLLHEVIYLTLRRVARQSDSSNARMLVTLLILSNNDLTIGDLFKALDSTGLPEGSTLPGPLAAATAVEQDLVNTVKPVYAALDATGADGETRRKAVKATLANLKPRFEAAAAAPIAAFAYAPSGYVSTISKYANSVMLGLELDAELPQSASDFASSADMETGSAFRYHQISEDDEPLLQLPIPVQPAYPAYPSPVPPSAYPRLIPNAAPGSVTGSAGAVYATACFDDGRKLTGTLSDDDLKHLTSLTIADADIARASGNALFSPRPGEQVEEYLDRLWAKYFRMQATEPLERRILSSVVRVMRDARDEIQSLPRVDSPNGLKPLADPRSQAGLPSLAPGCVRILAATEESEGTEDPVRRLHIDTMVEGALRSAPGGALDLAAMYFHFQYFQVGQGDMGDDDHSLDDRQSSRLAAETLRDPIDTNAVAGLAREYHIYGWLPEHDHDD